RSPTRNDRRRPALIDPLSSRMNSGGSPQCVAIIANGCGLVRAQNVLGQHHEIEGRYELALFNGLVRLAAQPIKAESVFEPEPNLGHAETCVNGQPVEPAARDHDLDRDVRVFAQLSTEAVTLVGLEATLFGFASKRRR